MNAQVLALPRGVERFVLEEIAPQPWRNGAGLTRLLAGQDDALGPRWRVSVADLVAAAPFSRFPGLDRCALLLEGESLDLLDAEAGAGAARCHRLAHPGAIARFPGEQALAVPTPARRARLLNVMVRRGQVQATLDERALPAAGLRLAPGPRRVLLLRQAPALLALGESLRLQLEPGEGLCLDGRQPALTLRPLHPDARLVQVELQDAAAA